MSFALSSCLATSARTGRAHLVGAGGAGMHSLAELLTGLGWLVSGSDLAPRPADEWPGGGPLFVGHHAGHVPPDARLVVHSDAVNPRNPELLRAGELGIATASYFECLGALTATRRGLAIAGTHGKSTTAAMLAEVLALAGLDPSWCFGAVPKKERSGRRPNLRDGPACGGHAGRGDLLVVEACEYRANFLHLHPWAGVVTGIEPDHFDYYRSEAELDAAFAEFVQKTGRVGDPSYEEGRVGDPTYGRGGRWIVRHECPRARRAAGGAGCAVETFGLSPQADWSARDVAHERGLFRYTAWHRSSPCAEVRLAVPGEHQVLNSLAALALAEVCGVAPEQSAEALSRFAGLHRRLEPLGTWRGADVLDDYAHHPTELAAALATVRLTHPNSRLWCVFQPHQASRTAALLDELASVMDNAETVLLAEIYRAREGPAGPDDVTAADLARVARKRGAHVADGHTPEAILGHLQRGVAEGDVVLFAGAGDIGQLARSLVG